MKITKDLWLLLLAIVILSAIIYLFGWATLTAPFFLRRNKKVSLMGYLGHNSSIIYYSVLQIL